MTFRIVILAVGLSLGLGAQSPEAMLRSAMDKEMVQGNLRAAIEQYRKVLAAAGSNRALAAKALARIGECHEKLGEKEARQAYERVVREFADQAEPVRQAQSRLAVMDQGTRPQFALRRVVAGAEAGSLAVQGLTHDGRGMAYVDWQDRNLGIHDLKTGQRRLITRHPAGFRGGVDMPAFAPDGKRVVYSWWDAKCCEIRIINLDGTGQRTLYTEKVGRWVEPYDWSPDGKRFVIAIGNQDRSTDIAWMDATDGKITKLAKTPAQAGGPYPHVSPDGRYVSYNMRTADGYLLRVVSADGSQDHVVHSSTVFTEGLDWTPDSKGLLLSTRRSNRLGLWIQPVIDGKKSGEATALRHDMGTDQVFAGVMGKNGTLYYSIHAPSSDIYTAQLDSSTGRIVSAPAKLPVERSGMNDFARWSPDSKRLSFYWSAGNARVKVPSEISVYDTETRKEQRIDPKVGFLGGHICWSPDGESLLTKTGASREKMTFTRIHIGSGQTTALAPYAGSRVESSCSTDGSKVGIRLQNGTLAVVNPVTGETKTLVQLENQVVPEISPDGKYLAYSRTERDSSVSLSVIATDGGEPRELVRLAHPADIPRFYAYAWTPDSKQLYFLQQANPVAPMELNRVSIEGGKVESAGMKMSSMHNIHISPDGKKIAFSVGEVVGVELLAIDNFLPLK